MVDNVNKKIYRDTVLAYVQKLEEVDKKEDQLVEIKDELLKLKKEASDLKQQIDNSKGKNK